MKSIFNVVADLGWLAGAGVIAYFFPWTFLIVQGVCLAGTLALQRVEKAMM